MDLMRLWPLLFTFLLAVQFELPTIEFSKVDQLTREQRDTSYQALTLSNVHSSTKNNGLTRINGQFDGSLKQPFLTEHSTLSAEYYLPAYSLHKPRDFYLLI